MQANTEAKYRIWVNYEGRGEWQDWTRTGTVTLMEAMERAKNIDHPTQILWEATKPGHEPEEVEEEGDDMDEWQVQRDVERSWRR